MLTAFVIESYQWLQEDFTETSAQLLGRIASGLANGTLDNTTPYHSPPMSPFTPTLCNVTINILWFLSLVLSLTAALLGMMVKKWLREYQTTDSESPEDAIWLRQIRYATFVGWKVPILIGTLPVLLELAIISFMIGLVTLLWTLHMAVAIVVSGAVAAAFVVVSTATVLPALYPGCPYKSPIAWGFVLLWDTCVRFVYRILWTAGYVKSTSYVFRLRWHRTAEGWKARDLKTHLEQEFTSGWGSALGTDRAVALKLAHLASAAAWVCDDSQNDAICSGIYQTTAAAHVSGEVTCIRLLAPIDASCRLYSTDIFAIVRRQYTYKEGDSRYGIYVLQPTTSFDAWDLWSISHGVRVLEILGTILLRNLETFVGNMLSSRVEEDTHGLEEMRAFVDGLCFLYLAAKTSPKSPLTKEFVGMLVQFYNRLSNVEKYDRRYPSLRTLSLQLLAKMGSFRFVDDHISGSCFCISIMSSYSSFKAQWTLIMLICPSQTTQRPRCTFIVAARSIRSMKIATSSLRLSIAH